MTDRFRRALALTLVYEGGKVDDPQDPGGRTNQGVTQRVYNQYRSSRGYATQDVYKMSDGERDAIYRKNYWDAARAGTLPVGLDLMVFDFAVHSGVSRAVKTLQTVLGVKADGIIGLQTLEAVADQPLVQVVYDYADARMAFLRKLKTFKRFGKGWERRVLGNVLTVSSEDTGIVDYAVYDIYEAQSPRSAAILASITPPPALAPFPTETGAPESQRADPADVKTPKGPAVGALAAAAGATGQSILAAAQQVQPQIAATFFGQLALGGFVVLMVAGGVLLAYSFYRKAKDAGLSIKELFS